MTLITASQMLSQEQLKAEYLRKEMDRYRQNALIPYQAMFPIEADAEAKAFKEEYKRRFATKTPDTSVRRKQLLLLGDIE